MSKPLTPFDRWEPGTNQNSIPANDNSLRAEIFNTDGIADDVTAQPAFTSPDDDGKWYLIPAGATGSQWATFAEDSAAIFYGGTWYEFTPVDGNKVSVDGVALMYDAGSGWVPWGGMAGVTSVNGDTGTVTVLVPIGIAVSDESTPLTAGAAKVTFRMPFAMALNAVRASLAEPQASDGGGGIFTVDINEAGSSILSTKLTIDNTEKTSVSATTPAVISDSNLADDAEITIDIDQIGDGTAKGLKVWLIGYPQ